MKLAACLPGACAGICWCLQVVWAKRVGSFIRAMRGVLGDRSLRVK